MYEVNITKEDIKNKLDVDLYLRFGSQQNVDLFLETVHRIVYDEFIYLFPNKRIQKLKIAKCIEDWEEPIRKMLLAQAEYLLSNNSNIGMWNGSHESPSATIDLKMLSDITEKILCPEIYNIAISCEPAIVYAGE